MTRDSGHPQNLPSGKNQSACWMMGSTMATTCTEVAAAISARVLDGHVQMSKNEMLSSIMSRWLKAKITDCRL